MADVDHLIQTGFTHRQAKAILDAIGAGPEGPPGPSVNVFQYAWKNQTTPSDPLHGYLKANNADPLAATAIFASMYSKGGIAVLGLATGFMHDDFILYKADDYRSWIRYTLTGPSVPSADGEWVTMPVKLKSKGPGTFNPGMNTSIIGTRDAPSYPQRSSIDFTTASLADKATATGLVQLAAGYRLLRLATSKAARVRFYTTAAKRDADVGRAAGTPPAGDHGLVLDFSIAPNVLSCDLVPVVGGFDGDATPDGAIPYTVTNLSGSAAAITTTLLWTRNE